MRDRRSIGGLNIYASDTDNISEASKQYYGFLVRFIQIILQTTPSFYQRLSLTDPSISFVMLI